MTARLQVGAVLAVVCPWPCSPPRLAFLPARRFLPPDPQPVGPRTPWTLWPPALGLPGGSAPLPAVPLPRLAAPSDRDVSALGPGIAQRPGVRVGTLLGLRPPRVFPRLLSADVQLRHDLAGLRSSTTPPGGRPRRPPCVPSPLCSAGRRAGRRPLPRLPVWMWPLPRPPAHCKPPYCLPTPSYCRRRAYAVSTVALDTPPTSSVHCLATPLPLTRLTLLALAPPPHGLPDGVEPPPPFG